MRTADTAVLWESNPAVRGKMPGFDLVDCGFHHTAEFSSLFFGDRCLQILNLGHVLSHEDDHGDFGNARNPGIAGQLRVQRKQFFGFFRIAACRGLPVYEAVFAIQVADGINVADKFASSSQCLREFDLEILLRISNTDSIVLRESLKEVDSLAHEAVPGISPFVLKRSVAEKAPFREQCCTTVFAAEISHEGLFKTTAKGHGRTSFFFLPAVQIAVAITARATQVLTDLRVA